MTNTKSKSIFVDPPYRDYYEDRLFDRSNPVLNRDGTLAPFIRLRDSLESQDIPVHTADLLPQQASQEQVNDYCSLGVLDNYERLIAREDVRLRAFMIFEPPVVAPHLYRALPKLAAAFDRVYVHNVIGDGYSLQGVDRTKLRQLFWPQPYRGGIEQHWGNEARLNRIVVINGNHRPRGRKGELYSRRIEAMVELSRLDAVDLYGMGWNKWWSHRSMWLPYWLNRSTLMSIYHGSCASKYEVLSRYRFCLCFENMQMTSYVTEKIFDCLYAGTIPLYLGAPDISSLIPEEAYIDCRKFSSWEEMWLEISRLSDSQANKIRDAGRAYLNSEEFLKYYDAMPHVVDAEVGTNN